MNGLSKGLELNDVTELVGVSYRTIQRWIKSCSEEGLEGLLPSFNGGKTSKLTNYQKLMFGNKLYLSDTELDLDDARKKLIDDFGIEYTKTHVSNLIKSIGFEYTASKPVFIEANIIFDDDKTCESTVNPSHKRKKTIKLIDNPKM